MAVIPQLKIDPGQLHKARRKLQTLSKDGKVRFEREEREALLALISAGKRRIYPSKMSLDRYQYLVDQLVKIDPDADPERFNHFAEKIEEFEKRYCK
ncbi:hypothetical protein [Halalkalibaculum sp. DA384]|uniref:hypothetical protein n=1 Tax=Halalkalibaculum sp. DA384 TaxID=3373606 RepID=UPI0037551D06